MKHLEALEEKSVFILREVKARFKNPAIMWSTGKDSTLILYLAKIAFFDKVPFDVIHVDTEYLFPEMYSFRDQLTKKWKLNLKIAKNLEAIEENVFSKGKKECCYKLKTIALKNFVKKMGYDALIVGIRRDEHEIRAYERYFSPRDKNWHWRVVREKTPEEKEKGDAPVVSEQDAELAGWNIFATQFKDQDHVRVHPILHWTEIEVWQYTKLKNIPFNPLYISKKGKRYRSLGCKPCTSPIKSNAKTIDEIIEELRVTKIKERVGRALDKEKLMERLRYLGYF